MELEIVRPLHVSSPSAADKTKTARTFNKDDEK